MMMNAGFPAAKKAKGAGGKSIPTSVPIIDNSVAIGEVRYEQALHARQAFQKLNGRPLKGSPLKLEMDQNSKDKCKLIVYGIPSGAEWQEVKDHFAQIAPVAFADVRGGGRKAKTFCGEVRFEDPDISLQAMQMFNGSDFMGSPLTVTLDPGSKDKTKLLVAGVPQGAGWQDLKDHFAQIGVPVAFCDIKKSRGTFAGEGGGAEVRYENAACALMAVNTLNGSMLEGARIRVALDPSSRDGGKLIVSGLNPTTQWQELKDHFSQCGPVAYAGVGGGKGGGMKGMGKMANMMNMMNMMNMGNMGKMGNMGNMGGKGNKNMSNQMVMLPAAMVQQMMEMMGSMSMQT